MEGDPDGARALLLPAVRGDRPAAGAVSCHAARLRRPEPSGDDPVREVRPAPAVEPAERALCLRGGRAEPVDARRPGGRACAAAWRPLHALIEAHVLSAERLHGDDTTVPILAKGQTKTGRVWVYVRDDRPFGGTDPPAALFYASRDRTGEHPERHLAGWAGILQADAFAGYNRLYLADRKPGPIVAALCWSHARRKFFELADIAANLRRGKQAAPISPIALEAVKRIDAIFDVEREINGLSVEKRLAARQEKRRPGRRARSLDARRAGQAVAPRRGRQGDGLHAHALGSLHPLSRRRPHLPDQQRGRTRPARFGSGQEVVVVRRIGSRGRARRCHVHAHPDRETQQHRSAGLARRRPRSHRRHATDEARRPAPMELGRRTPPPRSRLTS